MHGPEGQSSNVEQARRELQDATATSALVADRAKSVGEPDVASPVLGAGAESYLGLDVIKYLPQGGTVVVQTGDVQGEEPEFRQLMQVYITTTVDGAGHRDPHWELCRIGTRRAKSSTGPTVMCLPSARSES